ncbi:hypothetical protein DMENIID0001_037890 [Sergentomyia squamirostris]
MENHGGTKNSPASSNAPGVSSVSDAVQEGFAGFQDENQRPNITGASSNASGATTAMVPGFSAGTTTLLKVGPE